MDAFDLHQLLDESIPGNGQLKEWVRHHVIFALESRWLHEKYDKKMQQRLLQALECFIDLTRVENWIQRLLALNNAREGILTIYSDGTDRVKHWARGLTNSYSKEKPTVGEVTVHRFLFGTKLDRGARNNGERHPNNKSVLA